MGEWVGKGGEGERKVSFALVADVGGGRGSEYGMTDL